MDVALTGRTLGMVSPRKDAVAVMDGLAVASMFDALVHTDWAARPRWRHERTVTALNPTLEVSAGSIFHFWLGVKNKLVSPQCGSAGGREDRAGERVSPGIGGLGRPRDHVGSLTSLAAR